MLMMDDVMKNVHNWEDETELSSYLEKIVRGEAGDRSGLIYGMGHAVYTLSDPRAVILKEKAEKMAAECGLLKKIRTVSACGKAVARSVRKSQGGHQGHFRKRRLLFRACL